jgi:transcriptional regulator with XRE-family HTH domain
MATTPTVNRHQLGDIVRKFRTAAGLSQEQLGRRAFPGRRRAQAKVAMIENGDRSLHELELPELQKALGISDPELRAQMKEMWKKSRRPDRRDTVHAVHADDFLRYVDLEKDAGLIREVAVGWMPDLLMCESYIRTICAGHTQTPNLLEANVEARLDRAAVLTDDGDRRFHFVLCESAARKAPRGNRAVVREQVAHVIALSQRPNIEIQVMPFVSTSHDVDDKLYPFTYFYVPPDGVADAIEFVHIGAPDARRYINQKSTLAVYEQLFTAAMNAALGADDSRRYLEDIRAAYR